VKAIIRHLLAKMGIEIRRKKPDPLIGHSVNLKPDGNIHGQVLLSYILEPFINSDEALLDRHTHFWESMQIAKTFLALNYAVDVIDYRDAAFIPTIDYDVLVSARTNMERLARLVGPNCKKIVHLDTAHWLFNNTAALGRCLELQRRRGVTMESLKRIDTNLAIEYADCATLLGNQFTVGTYAYAGKPLHRIPVSTCGTYPWNETKDHDAVRNNYMWFGSAGLVHKGLDLVIEVFSQLPNHHLYICGPVTESNIMYRERAFVDTYHHELFDTDNIHTIGWCNVNSSEFIDLANRCLAIVYPSASEGCSGGVLNCMHAGLIPVVSYESGVDVGDYGVMLDSCSIDAIGQAVTDLSGRSADDLKSMSYESWRFVNAHHTREQFAKAYRDFVEKLLCQ
jgi:glycosyltransferase involved in cell wall biosynthesis